jgi:hypothetical protein
MKTTLTRNSFLSARRACALTLCLALATPLASASTLLRLTVDELTAQAEIVFQGEVIAVQAQRSGGRGLVSTFVTFSVSEVIKGSAANGELELKFLGGTLDGEVLEVNGSRLPRLGERGIYFVESVTEDLINPLLGWSQGQYLISAIGGSEQVTTVDARPVIAVEPAGSPNPAPLSSSGRRLSSLQIADDPTAASGIITTQNDEAGMSPDSFKARLKTLLP